MGAETVELGMAAARAVAPEAVVAVTELAEATAGSLLRREAGLVPMYRTEEYLTKQGARVALSVPSQHMISTGSYDAVEGMLKANRGKLTEVLGQNWNDVPLTGFHGATKGGAEFLTTNRTAQSVYGGGSALDVGTIETKSQNAAQLFTDMERASSGASAYVFKPWMKGAEEPGALFVLNMPERATPPKFLEYAGQKSLPFGAAGDSWGGASGPLDWTGTTKHTVRAFARFNPSSFDQTFIGKIDARELEAMGFNKNFVSVAGHGLDGDFTGMMRPHLNTINANQQLMARTMELLGFLKKI